MINYYFIGFQEKVKGPMKFLLLTHQNNMHPFSAAKYSKGTHFLYPRHISFGGIRGLDR